MNSFVVLMIFMLFRAINSQLCTHQYPNTSLEFDRDYFKIDWNLALLANSTKEKPKDTWPELKIDVLKDIDQLAIEFKIFSFKTVRGKVLHENIQTVPLCSSKKGNGYAKQIVNSFVMLGGFNIKCSHKKGEKITMRKIVVRDILLMKLYLNCNDPIRKYSFIIYEDKKVRHELLKLLFVGEVIPNPYH